MFARKVVIANVVNRRPREARVWGKGVTRNPEQWHTVMKTGATQRQAQSEDRGTQ